MKILLIVAVAVLMWLLSFSRGMEGFIKIDGDWKPWPIVHCDCGCKQSPCLCHKCYCDDALLKVCVRKPTTD